MNQDGTGRTRSIVVMVACSVVCQVVQVGAAIPLLSLSLHERGLSASVIGYMATVPWLAVLIVGFALPKLLGSVGPVRALLLGFLASAVALASFPLVEHVGALFALNFLFGCGLAIRWIVCDMWISAAASDQNRGRVIGLHETLSGGAIAVGPGILALFAANTRGAFLCLLALLLCASLCPLFARGFVPTVDPHPRRGFFFGRVARALPVALLGAFLGGVIESAVFAVFPLYGLSLGMTESRAASVLAAVGAGNVALQFLLGWLADRYSKSRLHLACGAAAGVGVALIPLAVGVLPVLRALVFLWGGKVAGLYTLGVVIVGQHYEREQLAEAVTAVAVAYTAGGIVGPAVGSTALDLWPPHGLIVCLAVIAVGFVLCGALFGRSGAPDVAT
jgi:MFS family permease